jgi:hypothetical protein
MAISIRMIYTSITYSIRIAGGVVMPRDGSVVQASGESSGLGS